MANAGSLLERGCVAQPVTATGQNFYLLFLGSVCRLGCRSLVGWVERMMPSQPVGSLAVSGGPVALVAAAHTSQHSTAAAMPSASQPAQAAPPPTHRHFSRLPLAGRSPLPTGWQADRLTGSGSGSGSPWSGSMAGWPAYLSFSAGSGLSSPPKLLLHPHTTRTSTTHFIPLRTHRSITRACFRSRPFSSSIRCRISRHSLHSSRYALSLRPAFCPHARFSLLTRTQQTGIASSGTDSQPSSSQPPTQPPAMALKRINKELTDLGR